MLIEGGRIGDLIQVTAALIVLGGTLGAVLVSSPSVVLWRAVKRLSSLVRAEPVSAGVLVERLVACSFKSRRHGLLALDPEEGAAADPFLRKALMLAVDGVGTDVIREDMELEISLEEQRLEEEARIFESAAGFAPTMGIIGAVLGLIQVMKHLDNIAEVGHGIAVAFVATVYGVGLANLALLPAAGKLRSRAAHQIQMRELALDGVIGIAEGTNPRLIRGRLEAYLPRVAPQPSVPEVPPARAFVVKQGGR
ncbi:MAG: MotA/TolQ/ExbB proton channel [Bryobacterales bacterium]|nr:MotA/TolQ/ExbB proton channel [Bryobacterales bacterium]